MAETITAPAKSSPKVKGKNRKTPTRASKQAKALSCNSDTCTGCHVCQPFTPLNYNELSGGRTLREESIHKQQVNKQPKASESKYGNNSSFEDPDQAEENREEEEVETEEIVNNSTLEKQWTEEPAAATPLPPSVTASDLTPEVRDGIRYCTPSRRWNTA